MQFQTMSQLGDTLKGIIQISKGSLRILAPDRIRGPLVDQLAWTATFHEKPEMRGTSRWIIKLIAPHLGITFHLPESLHEALREKKDAPVSVPSVSLKGLVYDTARAIFHAAIQEEAGAFLFKWPQAEKGVADISSSNYVALIAAAGIQAHFIGPLFVDTHPQTFVDKLQRTTRIHLSSETPDAIYNRLPTAIIKEQKRRQMSRGETSFSLEKYLWSLPGHIRTGLCSKMGEKFTSLCIALNIVQTQQAMKTSFKSTEIFFSIRGEIEAACAERFTT